VSYCGWRNFSRSIVTGATSIGVMQKKNRKMIYPLLLTGFLFIFFGSCSKSDNPVNTVTNTGETMTDIDGNVYHTVVIGNQTWITENLKVRHYNDSTEIPIVTDQDDWNTDTNPACCMYNNDSANFAVYGLLYNWYAASNSKLCPKGWHVATNDEWITLYDWLNDTAAGGGKLKETGTTHWISPNTGATNSTGFTALPGGRRSHDEFEYIGLRGYTWSSTEYVSSILTSGFAWCGWVSYNNASLDFMNTYDWMGFSVRCIKDK